MNDDQKTTQNPGSVQSESISQNPIINSSEPDFLTPPPSTAQPKPVPVVDQPTTQQPEQTQPQPLPAEPQPQNVPPQESGGRDMIDILKKVGKILVGLIIVVAILGIVYFLIQRFAGGGASVKLTYWGLWEDPKIMQSVISDFERQNPNISVEYTKQDIQQYRDRLVTRIENGTGPDIFRVHNSWISSLSPLMLPIPQNTISKSQFQSLYYPVAATDLIKNGAIYAVPLEMDTLALFVNTQLFQNAGIQIPTNWNEFIDASRALTVKDQDGKIKTAGAAMGSFDNIDHAADIISLLFVQNSVDLRDLLTSKDRVNGALNFYSSFATDSDNVWDNTLDPSTLAFAKGNLGMYFGYSWDYFNIRQFNPNLDFKVVSVPQLPNQTINLASYWAESVSVKTKHQKEALQFIKFLTQKETEEKLYTEESKTREFGEPYARMDLADLLKTNPNVYPFLVQAKDAKSSYFVDKTFDNALNSQSNTYLGNAVNSMLNGSSPESAFKTFSEGIDQVLKKYAW